MLAYGLVKSCLGLTLPPSVALSFFSILLTCLVQGLEEGDLDCYELRLVCRGDCSQAEEEALLHLSSSLLLTQRRTTEKRKQKHVF